MALPRIALWGPEHARAAVQDLHADYKINRLMLEEKDFWQDGDLWPGHRTGDPATDQAICANVKPQFVANDVLSEVEENYVDGLLKREASVTLDPVTPAATGSPAEQTQQEDMARKLRALAVWWDQKKFWRKVRATLKRSRYAALKDQPTLGRGDLRFWVAPVNTVETPGTTDAVTRALPSGLSLGEAFATVEVDDVRSDAAAIYTDPETRERAAVILTQRDGREEVEVWTVEGRGEQRRTVLRVLSASAGQRGRAGFVAPTFVIDLGGRLPLAEVEADLLVTPPVRQLQSILNFMTTTLPRTVELAGYKQRYLKNVEPPGMWLPYPPQNSPALDEETRAGTTFYKHRTPWVLGASIIAELQGIRIPGASGQPDTYMTPDVTTEEPTDPEYVTKAMENVEGLIYKRCRQGHLANTSTAEASGLAYAQARAQFENDLDNGKGGAEGLIRESLEILTAYAALMSEEARDLLTNYRFVVILHVHAGPTTPEEARLARELRDARIIAPETAMARAGVEDTAAELVAIAADPLNRAAIWEATTKALNEMLKLPDMTVGAAGYLLGLTPAQVQIIETGQAPAPAGAPGPRLSAA